MSRDTSKKHTIPPQILLHAYSNGIFPMSESAQDQEVFWVQPELRGVIPLEGFHVPKSLRKRIRQEPFKIAYNTDFDGVINGCAMVKDDRPSTWINDPIRTAYRELFKLGHCHTVEAWDEDKLVGGLYGVTLGGAFFGESMFSLRTDASKICLCHLVKRLQNSNFVLLDTQFTTDHLKRFGAIDVPQAQYNELLKSAITLDVQF